MRISSKIILLTAVLLAFFGSYAFISWQELTKIHWEFNEVAKKDLALMESASVLNDLQLKKEILFEKLTSSAEELAFGNINDSRRQYLLDYVKDLHGQFQDDSLGAQKKIQKAFHLPRISGSLRKMFENIQKTLAFYDRNVQEMFKAVSLGGYQVSMEDLDKIENQQADLTKDFKKMLGEVWSQIDASVNRTNLLQERSQHILWVNLVLSLLFALALASAIIHRIHTSLNILVHGVRALHQGKLGSHVTVKSSDEIGELASAFNRMSDQLKSYQAEMLSKNIELASSLETTSRQKRELEKINRDLDRYVHLISHDINGPLSGILGYSAYLQEHSIDFDFKTQQVICHLRQVTHRLDVMVKDLLEMTKITRIRRPFEKVEVEDVVKESLKRQEFLIGKTFAVINLPQSFPIVIADRLKLTVVFFNLIGNAIKYSSRKDEHKPQVDVDWQRRGRDFLFCIKDNGIGISSEHYQDIFDMFKRLPEAESFEGSGVGLAVVKEIIQEHGGQIWVESVSGQGSQFFFTIPLESPSRLG